MPFSDADNELLEAHLDGELSSAEEASLRHRLLSDQALAMELSAIRSGRALRAQVFESFEPNDLAVKRLVLGVRKQMNRDAIRGDRLRIMRYIASAAACVLFSFSAGWLGKSRVANQNTDGPPSALVQSANSGSAGFGAEQGIGTLVSNTESHSMSSPPVGAHWQEGHQGNFEVDLTDAFGRVIAKQPFDTAEEAREFCEDIQSWQKQQQLRGGDPVYKGKF